MNVILILYPTGQKFLSSATWRGIIIQRYMSNILYVIWGRRWNPTLTSKLKNKKTLQSFYRQKYNFLSSLTLIFTLGEQLKQSFIINTPIARLWHFENETKCQMKSLKFHISSNVRIFCRSFSVFQICLIGGLLLPKNFRQRKWKWI